MKRIVSAAALGVMFVLANVAIAADREAFEAKLASDKKDVESYIGLTALELQENNLEAAKKSPKAGASLRPRERR